MRPTFHDLLSLVILEAARIGRRKLNARDERTRSAYYDRFFDKKDFDAYALDPRMAVRRQTITAFLTKHVPSGASILDVGCGLGDVLSGLPEGFRLHGIEFSAENASAAQRRLGARAEIRQGSIHDLPFPSGSMDVCLCLEVLEHIADDVGAVSEMRRILRVGGLLIAAVPYTYYWPQYRRILGHYRHYDQASFVHLLEAGGFEVSEVLPNYPKWHQAFTRRYVRIRAASMLFGKLLGEPSIYRFAWPWSKVPAVQTLEQRLQPLLHEDAKRDDRTLPTSTFLVGRKEPA